MQLNTDRQICLPGKCTGCAACANACPGHCISIREDDFGESRPYIDAEKCVDCGLCNRACPNNRKLNFEYPRTCYASWITDRGKRAACASGGIGTIIAEYVIKHKRGVVVGTAYDENLIPRTICAETIEQIELFKGSKYVQSIISANLFLTIRDFLEDGRFVAYIGTPCQIAGLKSFLGHDYENLLTVDLICHGVSPTSYFREEIDEIVTRRKLHDIVNVRFRGNDGNNYRLTLWDKVLRPKNRTNFCLSLWQRLRGGG